MTTPTVCYLRVSTAQQADNGVSLAAQQAKVEAYAMLYELEIVEMVIDPAESAKTLERPKLQHALGTLGKTTSALLVTKLDRLTRSVKDLGYLLDKYFPPHTLLSVGDSIDTRSAAGRLMLNVLTSVAQWEREAIGERTRVAKTHQKSMGRYIGGSPPYGQRVVNGCLEPDPKEQSVIEDIRSRVQLGETPHHVAKSYVTRKSTPMSASMVQRIMKNV